MTAGQLREARRDDVARHRLKFRKLRFQMIANRSAHLYLFQSIPTDVLP
jgi:hypothetical protein